MGTGLWLIGRRADPRYKTEEKEHNTLFVCPEHAQIFARADWDRARFQAALYRAARLSFRTLMINKEWKALQAAHPELGWLADHPELPLPSVEDPECFDIAVVGGGGGPGPRVPPRTLPADMRTGLAVDAEAGAYGLLPLHGRGYISGISRRRSLRAEARAGAGLGSPMLRSLPGRRRVGDTQGPGAPRESHTP